MLIASLIEFPIAKNADVAKTQYPVSEFRYGQFACYLVSLGPLLGCSLRLGYRPVSSETEDKFEDAMEVTASSSLFEIACVLVRLDHIAHNILKNFFTAAAYGLGICADSPYAQDGPSLCNPDAL